MHSAFCGHGLWTTVWMVCIYSIDTHVCVACSSSSISLCNSAFNVYLFISCNFHLKNWQSGSQANHSIFDTYSITVSLTTSMPLMSFHPYGRTRASKWSLNFNRHSAAISVTIMLILVFESVSSIFCFFFFSCAVSFPASCSASSCILSKDNEQRERRSKSFAFMIISLFSSLSPTWYPVVCEVWRACSVYDWLWEGKDLKDIL